MADYRNALIELYASDPMRAINQRLGPMTPATRSGQPNQVMSQGQLPTMGESAWDALLQYGPLPAQLATAIAMQPVTAGNAVGDALIDPSLGSITNAGVQTAMALMAPTRAVGALAGGYGVAGARDLGLFGGSAQANDPYKDDANEIAKLRQEQQRIEKAAIGPQTKRQQLEAIANQITERERSLTKRRDDDAGAERDRRSAADAAAQDEYNRAVARAEKARDTERGRDIRWSDTQIGKVYNSTGGAPTLAAAFAGGAGMLDRLAKGAPKSWNDIGRLGFEGSMAAAVPINAPLVFNAFATESDNPERRAQEAYARELPQNHPRRAEAERLASILPQANPLRTEAAAELYDPLKFAERLFMAGFEGTGGALLGSKSPDALKSIGIGTRSAVGNAAETVGSLPGSVATGYHHGMGKAAIERGNSAMQRSNALEGEAALRETQRRLGEQRAAPQHQSAPAEPFPQAMIDPPQMRQLPSPVSSGNPSQPPQNNGTMIPDSITGSKSRVNKTYGEQNSSDLQSYVMGEAQRGVSPFGLVGSKVADHLGMKPTRAKTALQNIREIGEANGIDISDPKVLKAVIDELNAMPAFRNKKGNGNALFSLGGAGVGLNALMQDPNE